MPANIVPRRYAWAAAGLACAVLASGPTRAAPLTFQQALAKANAEAPALEARQLRVRAARSAADAAGALPDPTLDLSLENVPVSGPDAFSLGRDFMTMKSVGISQQFPNPAKRQARRVRAGADIAAAEASAALTAREVRVATALAWVDLYFGERRLAILKSLDESINDIANTVVARLAAGSARPSQGLEPQQLRASVADREGDLQAEITKAKAELSRWTGDPDPDATGALPEWTINPDRLIAAINGLPTLQALDAASAQAEADARLARAEKRPDWSVSVRYGRREPRYDDMVSVGVSIGLPLFSKHRQDPLISARAHEAQSARLDRQAVERELRAKLQADLATYRALHDRAGRARETLIPLAKQRAELDRASYAAGRIDLGTALQATFALAEAEIDALDREAVLVRDGIRINLTYGSDAQ